MRDFVKNVSVLFLITSIFTFILAGANLLTKDVVALAQAQRRALAMNFVLPLADVFSETIILESLSYNVGFEGRDPVGAVMEINVRGYSPDMILLVGIDLSGAVAGLQILSHGETPGLGDRIENEAWKAQFIGGTRPISRQVDSISGATVSVEAVFRAVDRAILHLQENILPNINDYSPQ